MTEEEIAKIINDIADDYAQTESELYRLKFRLHELISKAIAGHEQSKWKKYPENLPDWDKKYWALNIFGHESSCYGREFDAICVIAFRELPKSYQEGRER